MIEELALYRQLKDFIGFSEADAANLRALAPLFADHGAAITDGFYARLSAVPETLALISGRVDALKQTHMRWMASLFRGEYDDAYYEERRRIGLAHVRAGIPPRWVEAVTSFLRTEGLALIDRTRPGDDHLGRSYVKILDIDLWIIGVAYNDERLTRLSNFTGMSRKLIERCVLQGK